MAWSMYCVDRAKVLLLSPVQEVQEMAKSPNYDCFNGSPAVIIVSGDSGKNIQL